MWREWIWWQEKEKNGQLCAHAPPKKESAEFRRVVEKCSKCLQIIAGAEAKASAVVRYSTQPTTKEENADSFDCCFGVVVAEEEEGDFLFDEDTPLPLPLPY